MLKQISLMFYVVTNQFFESRIINSNEDMAPHEHIVFRGSAYECRNFLSSTF